MSRWYPCIYCTEDLHCTKYADDNSESWCVLGPCTAETPSNGDKIRRMTDEELAESRMLCPYYDSEEDMCSKWIRNDGGRDCAACALDWLKQEAT